MSMSGEVWLFRFRAGMDLSTKRCLLSPGQVLVNNIVAFLIFTGKRGSLVS
jgi:hypothetical protein